MSKKLIFHISGMHCSSCAMNIDGELEDTPGVKKASTSFAKNRVEVEFDEDQASVPQIIAAIARAGYKAETAAESSK